MAGLFLIVLLFLGANHCSAVQSSSLVSKAVNSTLPKSRPTLNGRVDARHASDGTCSNVGTEYKRFCGRPQKEPQASVEKLNLDIDRAENLGGICSQLWQDRVLAAIFDKVGTTNKYFLEFGARRPQILNSAHFRLNCEWQGLLLDGAPGATPNGACPQCADLETLLHAPDDAPARLRQAFLSFETVNKVFEGFNVPQRFDLLTIDIDLNDYWVLRGMDPAKFQPRVVAVEFSSRLGTNEPKKFSEKFGPNQPLVPVYNPRGVWHGGVTGSSLLALDELMQSRGYSYVGQVSGEHAIWVLNSELNHADHDKRAPDKVLRGWQSTDTRYDVDMYEVAPSLK